MTETINIIDEARDVETSVVPSALCIPLQTLSCHQCMMLFDAQGFINFRTGFSAQNLTGEDLSYVETMEDIVEMKTDMLKIQMRRLFAKIQEWKTRGIHKDEFFPKEVTELIPTVEASVDVIKRPDQSAVKSSSSNHNATSLLPKNKEQKPKQKPIQEKQQPLANSAVIGVSTATTTTYKQRKGEKRKYEHALILAVSDVREGVQPSAAVREGVQPSIDVREGVQPSVDVREGVQPSVDVREGVQPSVDGKDDSEIDTDASDSLQTISNKKLKQLLNTAEGAALILNQLDDFQNHEQLLDKVRKILIEKKSRTELLRIGFFQKITQIFEEGLKRRHEQITQCSIVFIATILNSKELNMEEVLTGPLCLNVIAATKTYPENDFIAKSAAKIIRISASESGKVFFCVDDSIALMEYYLYKQKVDSIFTLALCSKLVSANCKLILPFIYRLIDTLDVNSSLAVEDEIVKSYIALKHLDVSFSRLTLKQKLGPEKSLHLGMVLIKYCQHNSNFADCNLNSISKLVIDLLEKILYDHTTSDFKIAFTTTQFQTILNFLNHQCTILDDVRIIESCISLLSTMLQYCLDLINTVGADEVLVLLPVLLMKSTTKVCKNKVFTLVKLFLANSNMKQTMLSKHLESLFAFFMRTKEKDGDNNLVPPSIEILHILSNWKDSGNYFASPTNCKLYFRFIRDLISWFPSKSWKIADMLKKLFPQPAEEIATEIHNEMLSSILNLKDYPNCKTSLLQAYCSKLSCMPDAVLRSCFDSFLQLLSVEAIDEAIKYEKLMPCFEELCSTIKTERFWCTLSQWEGIFHLHFKNKYNLVPQINLIAKLVSELPEDIPERQLYLASTSALCDPLHQYYNSLLVEKLEGTEFGTLRKMLALTNVILAHPSNWNYFYLKKAYEVFSAILQRIQNLLVVEGCRTKDKIMFSCIRSECTLLIGVLLLPTLSLVVKDSMAWADLLALLDNFVQEPTLAIHIVNSRIWLKVLEIFPAKVEQSQLVEKLIPILQQILPHLNTQDQDFVRRKFEQGVKSSAFPDHTQQLMLNQFFLSPSE